MATGGSLTRRITSESAAGYGISILEVSPPSAVSGVKSNVIGVVADLPWGPVSEVTRISTPAELFSTFYPEAFGTKDTATYPAVLAFLNKTFPGGLRVVRVAATGQATSSKTFDDAGAGDSVTVTAKYPGALGDQISVAWEAASDGDASHRDAVVSIGTVYSQRYKNLSLTTVAAVDDPYVTFALAVGADDMPAVIAATALTGGDDGAAVAADYTGSVSSNVGIRRFYPESVDVSVLFVAECPSALVDAVNTGIEAYVQDTDKGMAVLCTVDGQDSDDAIDYPASYRDDRLVYTWPRVKTTNFFDPDLAVVEVDGNSFAAVAMASVDPEVSPGGAPGAPFLTGITDLESEADRTTLDDLNDAGVAPWFLSRNLGTILRRGVTTSLTSGLTKIFRRRMADFIELSIADYAEHYVEQPLDLDLGSQSLGQNSGALVGSINQFLADLKTKSRIASYAVDAFSGNVQTDIDAGRWVIMVTVKLFPAMEEIVIRAAIGETVEISES